MPVKESMDVEKPENSDIEKEVMGDKEAAEKPAHKGHWEKRDPETAKMLEEETKQLALLKERQDALFKEVKFDGHGAAPKEVEAAVPVDHVADDLIMSDATFDSFGLSPWMVDTLKSKNKNKATKKAKKQTQRNAFIHTLFI